jgi:hypothetical protein
MKENGNKVLHDQSKVKKAVPQHTYAGTGGTESITPTHS